MKKEMDTEKIDIIITDMIQNIVLSKYLENTIELESITNNLNELINECENKEIREKEFNILIRLNQIIQRVYGDMIPNTNFSDDEYFPNKVEDLRSFTLKNIQDLQTIINKLEF